MKWNRSYIIKEIIKTITYALETFVLLVITTYFTVNFLSQYEIPWITIPYLILFGCAILLICYLNDKLVDKIYYKYFYKQDKITDIELGNKIFADYLLFGGRRRISMIQE